MVVLYERENKRENTFTFLEKFLVLLLEKHFQANVKEFNQVNPSCACCHPTSQTRSALQALTPKTDWNFEKYYSPSRNFHKEED